MKKICFLAIAGLLVCGVLFAAGAREVEEEKYTIAYVQMVLNDWSIAYWEYGRDRCEELGFRAIMFDPNNDVQTQIDMVNMAVAQGADMIMIQPIEHTALKSAILEACDQGVIVFDHFEPDPELGLEHENYHLAVFGQFFAGQLAGQAMTEALGGTGKVGIIGGTAGAANARQRSEGFRDGVKGTNIQVVSEIAADWDRARAMAAAEDMITQFPDLDGIFAHDDGMAIGITEAIAQAGKTGDVIVTSASANEGGIMRVQRGVIYSTSDVPTKWFGQSAVDAFHGWVTEGKELEDLFYQPHLITQENAEEWLIRLREGW